MTDIEALFRSTGEFDQSSCIDAEIGYVNAINALFTSAGEFDQSSCIDARLGRVYAPFTGAGEFDQSSCIDVAKINIMHAYTQPITTTEQTTDNITLTWGS